MRGRGGASNAANAAAVQQLQVPSAVDQASSSFAQLSHIHYMTNNGAPRAQTPKTIHHSQQDMRLLASNGGKTLNVASLPRHRQTAAVVQESTLSHYSQPLANGIRLTQDHFNHNQPNHGYGGVYAKPCDAMTEPGYIHNNSHYSLPLDHDLPPSPTPTPPPPALPLRNGVGMALIHGNTTGRRSFNSSINNNNVATLSNNNHHGGPMGMVGVGNNNGSLRRYH